MSNIADAMQTPGQAPAPTQPVVPPKSRRVPSAKQQKANATAARKPQRRRSAKRKAAAAARAVQVAKSAKKKKASPKPAPVAKRKRGRPLGSKNKAKTFPPISQAVAALEAPTKAQNTGLIGILVAMARMSPAQRTETFAAIRQAFFDA